VISPIGTVLKSNILQQQTAGDQILLEIQLSTPFPYELDWVGLAPYGAPGTFAGTNITGPIASPALEYILGDVTPCASTAQGAMCVQTALITIYYGSGCSVDGTYTLDFAVTGCNTAGSTNPDAGCLLDNNDNYEQISVTVTISSLDMGDLCTQARVFQASASGLTIYADSGFATQKTQFIAEDSLQENMYIGCTISITDPASIAAYQGYAISSVARKCSGVSTCSGNFDPVIFADVGLTPTNIRFIVAVSNFTELTSSDPNIPYSVQLSAALLFSENSKRSVVNTEFELDMSKLSKRAATTAINTVSDGSFRFVSASSVATSSANHVSLAVEVLLCATALFAAISLL